MDKYTDIEFWENYWNNVEITPTKKVFFEDLVKDFPNNGDALEIGGFPGRMIIYFYLEKNCRVTILDFFISEKIIEKVEKINNLNKGTINFIKADLFNANLDKKYDIVISNGLIEHFEDTREVIKKHIELLKPTGNLLITLPNFKGINGWLQKTADKKNYDVHNIKCMDIKLLREVCDDLKLKNIEVNYFGKPTIWLEDTAKGGLFLKRIISYTNLFLTRLPIKRSKVFSPFIYIKAIK